MTGQLSPVSPAQPRAPAWPSAAEPAAAQPPPVQPPAPVPPPGHPAADLAQDWPLRDFLELGPLPGAVPCARYHARHIMWEWRLARLGDNVELLVAELVTNAVAVSRTLDWPFPVRVWLLTDLARVLIQVWDAAAQPPARIQVAEDAETGRGLLLVKAISSRWDWYELPAPGGKVVCALVTE